MATVARRFLLRAAVGERLLTTKLQILSGTSARRPSAALSILTGQVDASSVEPTALKVVQPVRRFAARTVYLSERHLNDIDRIIQAWQQGEPRRVTRSAVLRRAVEHLRKAIETHPDETLLENAEAHV